MLSFVEYTSYSSVFPVLTALLALPAWEKASSSAKRLMTGARE